MGEWTGVIYSKERNLRERERDRERERLRLLRMELENGQPGTPADKVRGHLDISRVHRHRLAVVPESSA